MHFATDYCRGLFRKFQYLSVLFLHILLLFLSLLFSLSPLLNFLSFSISFFGSYLCFLLAETKFLTVAYANLDPVSFSQVLRLQKKATSIGSCVFISTCLFGFSPWFWPQGNCEVAMDGTYFYSVSGMLYFLVPLRFVAPTPNPSLLLG